jgi:hypothetical protein
MFSRSTFLAIVTALAALAGSHADAGTVYDVRDGFTDNSTAFTYGRYTAGLTPASYSVFTQSGDLGNPTDPNFTGSQYAGLKYKNDPGSIDPNVIYNSTSSVITTAPNYGDITFNPHELTFGPFLGPTVARFTATTAGLYDFGATFTSVQMENSTPNYYVFVNGTQVATGLANLATVTGSTLLAANGTIDIVVFGDNANNKTTQIDGFVASVPEPASLAMSGTAILLVSGLAFGRRRTKV